MSNWGDTLWNRWQHESRIVPRGTALRPLGALSTWVVPLLVVAVAINVAAALNQIHKTALDGHLLDNPTACSSHCGGRRGCLAP